MKAIIPAAGQGTRLYPQTHTKPKAMIRLAGRPILGHILSSLSETQIEEVIIIVGGPMKEQIIEYAHSEYGDRFSFDFAEQENAEGLGHSIYQTEDVVDGESALIALGDMLFENGYQSFLNAHNDFENVDGSIGVKSVDEPQHYGVVEVDDGRVKRLVEKPDDPPSNFAISGVYIIENTDALFNALTHLVENNIRGAGDEFQLTDALQRMVEQECSLQTFEVEDWYDCGRPETLLEANRVLLSKIETNEAEGVKDSVVIPPVDFGKDVAVEESVVGPDVSVDDGAHIKNSIISDSIIGSNATLRNVNLKGSIIGDNSEVKGESNHLNIGDNSTISL